ncbi:Phosphoacetylglucosamine mutase [Symbiodinium microadriaticum]|uniref:Phosphoacetylglucosamine mutase n=1 Tax=Symbiodinium microadriaticum TaxID=2951 RepID=A0A1Q9D5H6_SYMMI|nr:Phosphoacetylglucosamine mutase [Symbiodinium microadriaticum]
MLEADGVQDADPDAADDEMVMLTVAQGLVRVLAKNELKVIFQVAISCKQAGGCGPLKARNLDSLGLGNDEAAKFEKGCGRTLSDAMSAGEVCSAVTAMEILEVEPGELLQRCLDAGYEKLRSGLYCAKLAGGETGQLFVLNGFYARMREKFTKAGVVVHWHVVGFDSAKLPWTKFRSEVIGATNPVDAVAGSLRARIRDEWKDLGLAAETNYQDNGVHASASPLESLRERQVWLGEDVSVDTFGAQQWGHSAPAETKSGSYIYSGSASAYHDWEFRTRIRVLQHKEKQKRELLKELRIAAQSNARAQSASPRKWASKARASVAESQDLPAGGVDRPTEDASSGTPASPSSARRRRTMPGTAVAEESDGDAGSLPSHPSQVEDEDGSIGDRAFTEPVMPTMADVSEADIDMSECVSKILEGLRGDAFSIARDIGLNRLLQPDGIDHLIEQIRQQAFPLQSEEASELFRQGQLLSGPLAKQSGEPMLSYIARRKRWWSTLCELDPDIRLSEAMRANLLVELSGLSRQEQLMVKTAARSQTTDEFARVLVQHHSVVHMKERLLTEKERPNTQRTGYRPWSDRQQHQTPKFGYMGYGYEEFDVAEPDQGTIPEEDLQEAAYPALGSLPDDESWIDDEEVAMQLNAYTAVSEEIGADDIDEDYAEAVQLAYAATNTLSTAKGKGKGKGKDKGGKGKSGGKLVKSNLTIADRKAKLQELKSKSRCLRCGVVGHWAGDAECRFKGNAKGAAGKPSATPAQSGGAPKPAPPKPQAYMAVEESDDDEVVILSNSGSQAHGYMAMKSSSTKTGKGSGVLAPRMRRSEASATMRDSPPPGSSTLFTFGQHRGLTYERVVHTYPGYVLWGQREKCPSKNLADFLAWVHEYYVVTDSEPIEVTRRERPLSETPVPVLEQPAAPSTGGPAFYVTCRGGCKEFSKSGSNAYIDMRTCKKCGAVTKTKKEKPVIDQATCLHGVTERTGSSRKTSRLRCKLCGMLLDEQPQDERKKRSEIAATVQESNTLDFDLLRSIASRTSEDLPVEVVVPAIDQFRETVEGHFATEPSITRGDLIAYLQEALEDQLPQESHNTSWEIASASAGGRSRSTRHGYVALMSGNAEGVTDTHPALEFSSNAARTFKGLSGETETLGGTSEDQAAEDPTSARGRPSAMGSRPGDDNESLEPSTYVRPSIVTSEGRAEAHRGLQAMLREYDEACTTAGITPEGGNAAGAARSCAPPATIHIPDAGFSPALLPPRDGTSPADMVVDVFTHGYDWNATVQRIRNKWSSRALFDHFEALNTSPITVARSRLSWTCIFLDMTHIPDARMADDADQAQKHRLQEQQRANTKHVGTHPNILNELCRHTEFIEHCRYILNVVVDAIHCGVQAINLTVVCKSNRHRSVGAGYLLGELCRYVKGTAVSITHMESAKTFPRMPFHSCKGRCTDCTHASLELWVDVQDILDGFVRKCRAVGVVDSYCVLVAEPGTARAAGIETYAERFHRECQEMEDEEQEAAAAAAAGPAAPSAGMASSPGPAPMDVDDEDSFVVPAELEGPVFKPPPAELMQQQAPIAPVIRPAVPPIPAGAPPPPTGPPTKAPAVDANKELIGKLRAEKEVLLAENGRLSRALRDTEEELAETRRQLRDAQLDLEESSRRAYRAERQLDDLRARRSRSRRRSYSPRDRRGDYRDRRDDPEERRYRRDDSRDIDFRRMDSRSRVRERSARADSSSHYNKIGRTARWGRDIAPAARPRSLPCLRQLHRQLMADASRGPGARATGSNEGPRGTATQPFISVYDQDDDEPWDTPGPPRSADAAGVGPVPTGGGFGTARIPPEPPRPRPTFRPSFTTGVGGGKGSGKSGDGGHRPTSYYDLPDRENPHRPLSGREARDYFRTWTPSEWKEFRRLYPRPPGQGRIIHIDEEMRSIEIAGIDRTGDVGLGWNRSINFGVFPDGILTELYNILGQKETPAMWIGPYSPTQFRAGDRRHHQLCEKHDLKVTCITPHTSPSYAPVGKPKDINPIGHLYSHNDVENRDTVSWCYEGTVYPYGMTASSTPGEAGEAERSCPSAPTDEDAEVYIVLWQYPLAFASDTAPMDLTDREELSRALEDSPDSTAVSGAIAARAAGPPGDQDTDPEDEELISDVEMAKAENAYWLLHENVPVLVNARKMRYLDERTADPVTAPATPRFPSYAETAVPEVSMVADAPEPTTHTPEQVVWETSPEERSQEDATAYMASLIDYHKSPVATQLGLDKAMETEWQKYVEFNAVVPCTREEMTELTQAGLRLKAADITNAYFQGKPLERIPFNTQMSTGIAYALASHRHPPDSDTVRRFCVLQQLLVVTNQPILQKTSDGRKVAERSSVSLDELLSNCDIDLGEKRGAAFDLLEEMDAEDTLKALESAKLGACDAAKAASQMLLFRDLINETVGDAISIFLAVEAVLYLTDSDCSSWRAMYDDLPNRQIKVVVKDRGLFETTDAERICVQPAGLQAGIDKLVAEVPQGRCFVRPSGTEDVVRVYVEAATETEMLKLGQAVVDLVYDTAGGVGPTGTILTGLVAAHEAHHCALQRLLDTGLDTFEARIANIRIHEGRPEACRVLARPSASELMTS